MMAHLVIVTKHHEALLREGVGEPLVPAQMLPEPVAEEDGRPHPPVPPWPPVAGEQLVTPGSVIMTGQHHHHHHHHHHNHHQHHLHHHPHHPPVSGSDLMTSSINFASYY